jgi:hypothetical protein
VAPVESGELNEGAGYLGSRFGRQARSQGESVRLSVEESSGRRRCFVHSARPAAGSGCPRPVARRHSR